ncbi:MAG: hypothetical protein M3327_02660 [Actinomycetota bacterium]|nr:hypothetical protein [Actinomycetota bacterium]
MVEVDLTKRTRLAGWSPSWSPDGERLVTAARSRSDRSFGLYIMDADGRNVRRITPPGREGEYATWSPIGDRIAFTYVEDGGFASTRFVPTGPICAA